MIGYALVSTTAVEGESVTVRADGHTYERFSIDRILKGNQVSPITGQAFTCSLVYPNVSIRSEILSWKAEQEKDDDSGETCEISET